MEAPPVQYIRTSDGYDIAYTVSSSIFDKTGAANRAQAAIYAKDHGLA